MFAKSIVSKGGFSLSYLAFLGSPNSIYFIKQETGKQKQINEFAFASRFSFSRSTFSSIIRVNTMRKNDNMEKTKGDRREEINRPPKPKLKSGTLAIRVCAG